MTNAIEPKELTPEQLRRLAHFETRYQLITDELLDIETELEGWTNIDSGDAEGWGEPSLAGLVKEAVLSLRSGTKDEVKSAFHRLRLTHGIPAFAEWWEVRIVFLAGLARLERDLSPTAGGIDDRVTPAEIDTEEGVARRQRFIAVDAAVRAADPEFVGMLDDVAVSAPIPIDRRPALARHGLTEHGLAKRAAAIVETLIESGWRP